MQYYIKDNFYFDIDHNQQLRISGLENHLLMGLSLPKGIIYELKHYEVANGQLLITLEFRTDHLELPMPIVTDIRTLRSLTEQMTPRPTYQDLIVTHPQQVLPRIISTKEHDSATYISFTNNYKDEAGVIKKYGSRLIIPSTQTVSFENNVININGASPLIVMIKTVSNIKLKQRVHRHLFQVLPPLPEHMFSRKLLKLYDDAKLQVEHLIKTQKTSSFEYGTIFPRDWIESADLGDKDFSMQTIDYMYDQSMSFVSDEGEGWHENIIGEFKTKNLDTQEEIDRKMIDIEPRYIIGMNRVSRQFLNNPEHKKKLKLIAEYILKNARSHTVISFKKKLDTETYEMVGNWRDSFLAYPRQRSPLAPYDVNCVFYPISLKIIRKYATFFDIKDVAELDRLIEKWDNQKIRFRLYQPEGLIGYSLALQGAKQVPLPINHLDEAYDLFYGVPSLEEIVSFAKKIVDPDYFFTPVGPLLVAADEEEFSTQQYHGKVIWPKQAAFSIAGLTKQYHRGVEEMWPWAIIDAIKYAIVTTSQACFKAWEELEAVPELYYYDQKLDRARFYTDQPEYEGQMSLVQLWSSVGCRRIVHDYISVIQGTVT